LDFAFNNAGIEPKRPAPTADYDLEEWDRIIAIDLRGIFLSMKYEIPLMLKHGGGAIVNTSSGAGVIGIKGSPAYTAAKHGVIGLTRAAALDYAAQNIRVNAVCPGYIDTPMMDRFTGGTAAGRAKVISEEPIGRMGQQRLPMPFCGSVRMRHALSLEVLWSSTVAKRFSSCTERIERTQDKESNHYGNQKSWHTSFRERPVRLVHRIRSHRPTFSGPRSRVCSRGERHV
jgi:NAD(P)-dependent dehydrogenase (short-subunit alcohol dehydrogenase family)